MRILLLNYEWPPLGGGASPVCHEGARALAERGHEIDVVTMAYRGLPRVETAAPGLRVHRVSCWRRRKEVCSTPEMVSYVLPAVARARALMRERAYDVNYTHFLFPTGVASWLLHLRTGLPYVVTSHGSDIPGHNPKRFQLQHRLLKPLWRRVARKAAHITVPSRYMLEGLMRNDPKTETSVLPNGMTPWPAPPPDQPRRGILAVSRLFVQKRFQHLFEAVARAGIDAPITLVGDGPYRAELEALARRLSLDVTFAGWLERDSPDYRRHFREAECFVFPSEKESFGMVLLEAMTAGLPCVVVENTGPAEIVGDAGLTYPFGDIDRMAANIENILTDGDLRHRLGAIARRRSLDYAWPKIAERLEAILQSAARPVSVND